ncbi:MAG TPA: ABC transporter substrate-binding protein [Polyangiaceae bacterium]|nr:ABC transporter substrate-binding protein [Polyangiaceae bacterium]
MELGRSGWRAAGTAAIVGLLAVSALQLHSVEARLSTQSQQLRALSEATERMAAKLERVQGGAVAAPSAQPSLAGVLHPEVKDFLSPKETHWPPAGARTNGTIAVDYYSGDPKGFNPVIESNADLSDKIRAYVEARLAARNRWTDPNTFYGDLAWRVEVTDNYKEFTFYLRKGVKWHPVSGVDLSDPRYAWLNKEHEVTAHDFVFYFDMLMHPQVQNGFLKSYFEQLESWKALDDYTLQVKWKKTENGNVEQTLTVSPLPKFLYAYAEDGTPIPEATLGLAFNQHWYNNRGLVGAGPYRLTEYKPGSHMLLERNEQFHGELPAIKSMRYVIYTDRTQTVLKLKSGELSFGQLRPGQYREEVQQYQGVPEAQRPKSPFLDGSISCDIVDHTSYYYIGWNQENPLFSDRRVRTAMTLALNRPEIISRVFNGLAKISRGPFLESSGYLAPEVEPLPFDLKQAAALLKEAGWADTDGDGLLDKADAGGKRTPFTFSLLAYGASPEWASTANIFKEDLLAIGVKMSIELAEWPSMLKRMEEKKFDAYTGAWALPWSTDPYQVWHSSQADVPKGSNRVGFRNKKADAIIEELRVTLDLAKRTELLRAFHRIVAEEQPYSFMFTQKIPYCHRNTIQGVVYAKERPLPDILPWWSSQAEG